MSRPLIAFEWTGLDCAEAFFLPSRIRQGKRCKKTFKIRSEKVMSVREKVTFVSKCARELFFFLWKEESLKIIIRVFQDLMNLFKYVDKYFESSIDLIRNTR